MSQYLLRRLLQIFPVLLIITIIVFSIIMLLPGDAALAILPEDALRDESLYRYYREQLGLERSMLVQYLDWMGRVVQGDLGVSFRNRQPVMEAIIQRLGPTTELAVFSLLISLLIALPIGVISAIRPNSLLDTLGTFLALAGVATPNFWLGIMLILLFSLWLGWLPAGGYTPFLQDPIRNLQQMIMPSITLGTAMAAVTMRQMRSALMEVLTEDYVTVARAKGLREYLVVVRHALKNALIPVVTIVGMQIGGLAGGTVIVETVFSIPGVGRLMVSSLTARDYPMILGVMLFMGIAVMVANALADVMYAVLDPRIRYESREN